MIKMTKKTEMRDPKSLTDGSILLIKYIELIVDIQVFVIHKTANLLI